MKNKLTVLLLLFSSICFSQFGNTWIDYSAPHYTFKITQDGIYRLPYETLANAFPGNNSFWMEINPYKNGSTIETDQPE